MSGFPASWLALRAAADRRARDPGLATRLGAYFAGRTRLRIVDLGSGTGANLRVTAPLIDAPQHWLLADHDPVLLGQAGPTAGCIVERRAIDLSGDLTALFEPAPDLVTTSAFLDLAGAAWLDRLAEAVVRHRAVLYAVLSYDGRERWQPAHPLDESVLAAFHADQRRDKGLGEALGPAAHPYLMASLRERGYRVGEAPSDWVLEQPRDRALIATLAAGSAAAVESALGRHDAEDWRIARSRARRVSIGHRDLLALPLA